MISIPGILLGTKNEKCFTKILKRFLDFKKEGLIPNIIGNSIETSFYNSVDASLWLFWTLQQFLYRKKCSYAIIKREFWEDLKEIFFAYLESQPEHLKCNELFLLESGTDAESYTWVDACLDGKSVVPRKGMVVEINALWYNAVAFVEELAEKFKEKDLSEIAKQIKENIETNYSKQFYIEEKGYLADYVFNGKQSQELRPNQLLSISLPYSPVSKELQKNIVNKCTEKLLTPYGLRTLSPDAAEYRGQYQGDVHQRDRAYHNGTVWPWLMGPYFEALIKNADNRDEIRAKVKMLIEDFDKVLEEDGLYSISEIFDADAPHQARGCIAQAWSVAELRRIYLEL